MESADVGPLLGDPGTAGIILDIDGTLAPIVSRPELAAVPPAVRAELARLVGRYALLAVVTGRLTAEATELVGVPGVAVAGLYGIEDAPPVNDEVLRNATEIAAAVTGARVEPKGASVAIHVRETADPDRAERELMDPLRALARASGIVAPLGKRVIELVPGGRPRKGSAVARLVADADLRAVLYAGDDLADVEAFEALHELATGGLTTICVAVHGNETPPALEAAADLVVEGSEGMLALLRSL